MALFKRNNKEENNENENIMKNGLESGEVDARGLHGGTENEENAALELHGDTEGVENIVPELHESGEAEKTREINFARHFLPVHPVKLANVSYETETPKLENGAQVRLGVKDTVVAQVQAGRGVKVTFNRALSFEPDGPFTLSVSFAVMLLFNPKTAHEVDWKAVDVATQFRQKCPALMQSMMSRSALLVAQITSADGSNPIVPLK